MTVSTIDTISRLPDHPGRVLKGDFLEPLGISQQKLSEASGVPKGRISEIVNGKRGFTAETGLRISLALGLPYGFFYNLQAHYESAWAYFILNHETRI